MKFFRLFMRRRKKNEINLKIFLENSAPNVTQKLNMIDNFVM